MNDVGAEDGLIFGISPIEEAAGTLNTFLEMERFCVSLLAISFGVDVDDLYFEQRNAASRATVEATDGEDAS